VARCTEPGHRPALEALELPAAAAERLAAYLAVLAAWNRRINLTAARNPTEQVALLVAPVLPLLPLLRPGALVDVGSGNGSPGLIVAALDPGRSVCLLEPRVRRWAFLKEAARAMGRPELRVLRCRHDGYPGPPVPNVTIRALRVPSHELLPLLAPGGLLFVVGAPPADEEGLFVRGPRPPRGDVHVLERRLDVSRET
jgi:16S rRNA (guanine527-N7)-methyltransferase